MVLGWRKGLLGMVGDIGGLVLGLWLGIRYSRYIAGLASNFLVGPAWLLFLFVFLGLFLSGRLVGKLSMAAIGKAIGNIGLTTLDRIIGAILGLGIGTVLVSITISFCSIIPSPWLISIIQTSEVGQYFWSVTPIFSEYLWQQVGPRIPFPHIRPSL